MLAVTDKGRADLDTLKAGTPCTAAPENEDLSMAEGATVGTAFIADTAVAAIAKEVQGPINRCLQEKLCAVLGRSRLSLFDMGSPGA